MFDIPTVQRVVQEMSSLEGTAHSFEHVNRVLNVALSLIEEVKANAEIVQLGSLLHDIGRTTGESHHAENGVEPARRILSDLNYPQDETNKVLWIVEHHDVNGRDKLKTMEGRLVWDADKLDLIGLTGVSRAFHFAGERRTPFNDAVKWCIDKGMHQPYEFFTQSAREIAKRRYSVMKYFALTLENELSSSDINYKSYSIDRA